MNGSVISGLPVTDRSRVQIPEHRNHRDLVLTLVGLGGMLASRPRLTPQRTVVPMQESELISFF